MRLLTFLILMTSSITMAADSDGSGNDPTVNAGATEYIILCTDADSDGSGNRPEDCTVVYLNNSEVD